MLGAPIPPVIVPTGTTTDGGIAPLAVAVGLLVFAIWVTFRWARRAAVKAQMNDPALERLHERVAA